MCRAITSLPTPLSPVMRTFASPAADRRASASTSIMAALPAMTMGAPIEFGRAVLCAREADSFIWQTARYFTLTWVYIEGETFIYPAAGISTPDQTRNERATFGRRV